VPPAPVSSDLQTVFLFTGLQNAYFGNDPDATFNRLDFILNHLKPIIIHCDNIDAVVLTDAQSGAFDGVSIIQPVLQWGSSAAGGGNVSIITLYKLIYQFGALFPQPFYRDLAR